MPLANVATEDENGYASAGDGVRSSFVLRVAGKYFDQLDGLFPIRRAVYTAERPGYKVILELQETVFSSSC